MVLDTSGKNHMLGRPTYLSRHKEAYVVDMGKIGGVRLIQMYTPTISVHL